MVCLSIALPFIIAVGAAIGWVSNNWAWCAAVSLPIGYYFSTEHGPSAGFLNSQIFDFPPVFFATLVGFAIARKIRSRWAPGDQIAQARQVRTQGRIG
jgi:hypothetical protein